MGLMVWGAAAVAAGADATDLFISEYVEGSSNNKFIEIFNGTGSDVDLSNYALVLYANGSTSPTTSNTLSGTLVNGTVKVYRNASATIYSCDTLAAIAFNGDDAIALWKKSTSSWVDIFGRIGERPSTAWTSGSLTTVNKTLVRLPSVMGGVTANPGSGFPSLGTEWTEYNQDTISELGSHAFDGGGGTSPPTVDAISGQSAVVDVALDVTVTATEADGDPVHFACTSAVNVATWTFNTNSGAFSFTATSNEIGAVRFWFTATDVDGTSPEVEMAVTVSGAPEAPTFNALGAQSATVGVAMAFTVSATGSPDPTLALQEATASTGYVFTAGTGELSYTPPLADIGSPTFTFIASNTAGVATQIVTVTVSDAPATLPVFNALGAQIALVGSPTNVTVSATGYPAPALALTDTTASTGYVFTAGTGALSYTPPLADVGTPTFTFTASNTAGVATQVVSVSVSEGPFGAPIAIWASATNTTDFTAAWSSVSGAVNYELDVSTNAGFGGGGAGGSLQLGETFDTGLAATYTTGNLTLTSGVWNAVSVYQEAASASYGGSGSAARINDDTLGACLRTPALNTAGTITFWYRELTSGGGDFVLQKSYDDSVWVDVATQAFSGTTYVMYSNDVSDAASTIYLRVLNDNHPGHLIVDQMEITAYGAGEPDYLSGYSNRTVTGTSQSVTGLTENTEYFFRARAVSATNTSANSSTANVTTGIGNSPPVFIGLGTQDATVGVALPFTVSATGNPLPVLALQSTSASTGVVFTAGTGELAYTPPLADVGSQTFTFTASNSEGMATQVVMVTVTTASAPVFGSNPGPLGATTGVARAFIMSATGSPDPALELQGTTASSGYSFTTGTGVMNYTAPTNDVGTQTFTFTASNVAGVVTQAVEVTVELPPAIPTLDSVGPVSMAAGETTNLWIVARETDGDTITLFASNLPANASFTTTGGIGVISNQFTFSPASNQAGQVYSVVFYAGDIHGTHSTTLNITVANNDPWADYYASCYSNGVLLTGVNLKNALHNIIDGHTQFSYAQTESILADIDECPTNSTMVQMLYLQYGRAKSNFGASAGQWNREHVWANSHGINDNLPAYSDVHHLHPTDVSANSARGNLDFDTVGGLSNSYSYNSGAFEPPDAGKGDVARAMFYMAVRYDGSDGVSNLELTNAIPTSTSSSLFGKLDTLLDWNELDDVNAYETRRNDLVYSDYQRNRNPFVDHPEWARVVFDTNYVANPSTPTAFTAEPNGQSQMDLAFALNGTGDDVIIVWNGDGNFSAPSGSAPAAGNSFAGGTVLYKGGTSPRSHTGLSNCQTVFYKCWAYSGTNYSLAGLTASATTAAPDAPATLWAGLTNAVDFTAVWGAVSGITTYRLDVATGPGFTGTGEGWATVLRETMGNSVGTTTLAAHELADGFDNDAYAMTDGGEDYPADIRTSSGSGGYTDPAGNPASSNANVYFTSTGSTNLGFAIEGIDTHGYEALSLSFGYRKENAATNLSLSVDWSTNSGAAWNPVTVSNWPAADAAIGWYMVSNLTVSAAALDATNLSLRWTKNGGVAGRVDDILLQGFNSTALFVPGYSNRPVTGTTSAVVTGLTTAATYYFRVASDPNCAGNYSSLASVTTLDTLEAPSFGANPGPFSTTVDVEVAFAVMTGGSPVPVLAYSTTATGGTAFDPETGACTYTPPVADIGVQTFTFTASNTQGAATQVVEVTVSDWPAVAPAFTSGTAYGATTGVARVFTVTAAGYPAPTLALSDQTASGGYSFTPATGQLAYTPPEADAGSPTFTFTAGNASGIATQVVTVAVEAGLPSAPAALWAADTNVVNFTAEWTAVPIATGYSFDVSTKADFQVPGGESVSTVLASNAATSAALITNEWSGTDLGGDLYVILTQSTAEVVSPAFSTMGQTNLTATFEARTYGGSTASNITVSVSTNNGTDWAVLGVLNPTNGPSWVVMPVLTNIAHLGHAQTRIRWQALDANAGVGVGIRSLLVTGWSSGMIPSFVDGYSNRTAVVASQAVTGLVANTLYYFRVRSENAAGTGSNSVTASVTTRQKADQTIDFPAVGDQVTTNEVPLSATASSGLGVALAVMSGPAAITSGTHLSFTGAGEVSIAASQAGDDNWNAASDVTHVFTVSKATATVTLGGLAQTFDGTDRIATATTAPSGLAVNITYDGSATAPTNAGSYAVTGTVNDVRYDGSASGTLDISKASATVTLEGLSQTYDGSSKWAAATTVPASLIVVFTYEGSATAPTAAGRYAVTGTVNDVNYTGSAVDTLVVSKAAATVTLGDVAQTFDGTERIVTASTVPAGLMVDITYDGSATALTNAGSYAVTGTVNDVNYTGTGEDILVVSKASATVTLGDLSQTADGPPRSATATTIPAGLTVDLTYDGSAIAPSNTGSYAVTGTVNDVNYAGSTVGALVLDAALSPFELWLENLGKTPGDTNFVETADYDGDGVTTWNEFLADTDPAESNNVLALAGNYFTASQAGDTTGQIRFSFPASTGRYYQLEYCTDLTNHLVGTTNLGWGIPDGAGEMTLTNKSTGTWYGVIRVFLDDPGEP